MLKTRVRELAWITGLLLLVTVLLWLLDGDLSLARLVHEPDPLHRFGDHFWPIGMQFPWRFFYNWAPVPAFTIASVALVALVAGYFAARLVSLRRKAAYILLFLLLGPGLVVNVLLKDQLGRARPEQVIEFGGQFEFSQFWESGTTGRKNSSFPSGHAAIAFFAMAPWFVLRDSRRGAATGFLVFGLIFGSLVGTARILQGGHFLTDVIWAGGLIYLVGGLLALAMGFGRDDEKSRLQGGAVRDA